MAMQPNVRARIGLLPAGHHYYWDQYPRLKQMGLRMYDRLRNMLEPMADIVAPELVDTPEKSREAGLLFAREAVDLVLVFPFGYTPSMDMLPALQSLHVPVRILNAHEDRAYDYATADTTDYLHHEAVCCVPELAGALVGQGRRFRVRTGPFDDPRLQHELQSDFTGAAAAREFLGLTVGLIGQVYPGMTDMPIDESRLLRATGRMLARPEVEEFENAFHAVTDDQLEEMLTHFETTYEVDSTVTRDHMRFSAQVAVAYDAVIRKHDISAFGYYWWGERELMTQLRAQSGLAVSRLAAMGRPGVTEGDVKTAMAMKILDLLGGGGMFVEFFAMDFNENSILMGHDGPANINVAAGRSRLMHLDTHHGKSGHGLGIDFDMQQGPVTLLNLSQHDAGDTFKLIYSVGEIVPGTILGIGNPNARVRIERPLHEFIDAWCQQGPSHHIALGIGDHSEALETFAEAVDFPTVRV
ncbi:MAG: hypothetical protein F4Y37_07985 [Caldilineaceae bacterium SB0664_bin_22]|nr:hypothetical protein [Caldilineaceae bacterium SB0664_bin_22]